MFNYTVALSKISALLFVVNEDIVMFTQIFFLLSCCIETGISLNILEKMHKISGRRDPLRLATLFFTLDSRCLFVVCIIFAAQPPKIMVLGDRMIPILHLLLRYNESLASK